MGRLCHRARGRHADAVARLLDHRKRPSQFSSDPSAAVNAAAMPKTKATYLSENNSISFLSDARTAATGGRGGRSDRRDNNGPPIWLIV